MSKESFEATFAALDFMTMASSFFAEPFYWVLQHRWICGSAALALLVYRFTRAKITQAFAGPPRPHSWPSYDKDFLRELEPLEVAFEACIMRLEETRYHLRAMLPLLRIDKLRPPTYFFARYTAFGRAIQSLVRWLQTGQAPNFPLRRAFEAYDLVRYSGRGHCCWIVEHAAHARLSLALGLPVHVHELAYLGNSDFETVAQIATYIGNCWPDETCDDDTCDEDACHCRMVEHAVAVRWLQSRDVPIAPFSLVQADEELLHSNGLPWVQRGCYCESDYQKQILSPSVPRRHHLYLSSD